MITIKPTTDLQLTGFKTYTRQSYFDEFKKPAPPADPSRRAKPWIGNGTFFFLESVTPPIVFKQETVPVDENLPNLDGAGPFPPYVIAPSKAFTVNNHVRVAPYNALYLSLQADAQALMTQLGGTGLIDASEGILDYDPDEARREWEFTDQKGVLVNVGALLFIRNMHGVGCSGHWDQSGPVPLWVNDTPVVDSSRPPWSLPCRALASNESIKPEGLFNLAGLEVDDGKADPATPAPLSGGSFTESDRNKLASLAQDVATILQIAQQLATK